MPERKTTTIEIGSKKITAICDPFDLRNSLNSFSETGYQFIMLNVIINCEKMSGERTEIIEKQYLNINKIDLFY